MGLIKEPLNVDFEVDPRPLNEKERKMISDFINADKLKKAKMVDRMKKSQKARTLPQNQGKSFCLSQE